MVYPQSVLWVCRVVSSSCLPSPISLDIPLSCVAAAFCVVFKELPWFSSWILHDWKMQHFRAWNFLIIHVNVLQRESWNYTDIMKQQRNYELWAFLCLPFSHFSSCIYKNKGTEKKIVKKNKVLKTLSTLFSVFSFYRFDEKKNPRFSPTFGGLQFFNKIFISSLRNKNNENCRFKRSIFYCP